FQEFVVFRDRRTKKEYTLQDTGVIITEKLSNMLGVKKGDTILLQDGEYDTFTVEIADICENYMGNYIFMTSELYESVYGESPQYNSVYFSMKEGQEEKVNEVGEKILKEEGTLSISYSTALEGQVEDMLDSLNIVLVVLIISAGMLAFVVLYNLNSINITERRRELATIKVLGFYDNEVSAYVYRENIILTLIGALVGMILGKILHQFVIVTVEIDSAMFGRTINVWSFIYGFLITMGFSLIVNIVMYFKLKKIDMVESLKSVE
ncbi:MAG: ABC transporter permease, partial [Candidatus Ruminococcus intestinipullorum]|nr:ABC transporter permease [Candidatus Ruminococcus intestinipullorum]